jgi:hypothetical protein
MTARQRAEANESKQAGGAPILEQNNRPHSKLTSEPAEKKSSIHHDETNQQLMGSIHSNSVSKGKKSGSIAVVGSKGNLKEESLNAHPSHAH